MSKQARWTITAVAILVAACGDQLTEVVPERQAMQGVPNVALATTSTEDGLSITTDKDDYTPGDTVWFTGAGWPLSDTLDILLEDEPATHEPHRWWVPVDEQGSFRDSTYVVDGNDFGVTFTLTATSRKTGRSLTVTFTDGRTTTGVRLNTTVDNGAGAAGASTAQATVAPGSTVNVRVTGVTFTPGNNSWESTELRLIPVGGGTGTIVCSNSINVGSSGTNNHDFTFTAPAAAEYNVQASIFQNNNCSGGGGTTNNPWTWTNGLKVVAPGPTKLAFTTDARSAAVGQCTAQIDVQSQIENGTPTNVTGNTTLTLTSTSAGGSFHTDAACSATGPIAIAAGTNTASFYYKDSNAGSPTLTASATGLTAATQQQTITAGNAMVTVTASPISTTVFGQSVSFTATVAAVAPAVGTPTGSVTFHDGAACSDTQIGAAKTLAGGSATSDATTALAVGGHTITGCYGGGGGFSAQTGQVAHTVNKASTSTAVTSSTNPSVFSQSVTFTVAVSVVAPGAGTPGGNVTLKDGSCSGSVLGGPILLSGGQASFNVSGLDAGPHNVTGCYAGNDDFNESDGFISQTVNKAQTTTAVSSSANPSVFSQPVTFEVTVSPVAPAVAVPAGSVTLKNGTCAAGTSLGGATLVGGKASFEVTTLGVGPHSITGCYAETANFQASHGSVAQQVNKAQTSTTVSSDANPAVFSQPVTFTVTVTPDAPAVAVPQGNVALMNGTCSAGSPLGGPTTLAGGQATFAVSTLSVASHTITACYAGNASFEGSDGNVTQVVNKASTTTVVTSSVNPSILAQPVTFDVEVSSDAPATATPQGNVTLKEGTCAAITDLGGPAALGLNGRTSFTIATLSAGVHTIVACYAGNASFEPSDNSLSQQVKYNFDGLFAPVDRPNTMNVSKAGQSIPLKWRLTDFNGAPVLDFSAAALGVTVSGLPCATSTVLDQIEEYAGNSGLQNLGNGYYQFNWKTPASYALSCRGIGLNLGEGSTRGPLAYFNFKK